MVSTALLMLVYLSFISLGLPDSMLGSAWPALWREIGAPLEGAGLVQMVVSVGTIVSSLQSARMIRRFGTGRVTAFSVTLTAVALWGFSLARNYGMLLLLAIPLGLGAGAVDAALNNFVALHCRPSHMSWLHCFWGVGTLIGPAVLSGMLSRGISWRAGYQVIGALQGVVCALLWFSLPMWRLANTQAEERQARALRIGQVLALPGAKQGMTTFLCYCAVESTLGLWGATFLSVVRGATLAQAASCGAMYYVGITVGRAVSGFVATRLLPRQMVRIGQGLLLAGCALLAAPLGVGAASAGLLICGLGCAPIYPNIIQDTPVNYGEENSQAAIGVQMASAYVGSTLMPSLFGALAGAWGYALLPIYALSLTALMTGLFAWQKRIVQSVQQK